MNYECKHCYKILKSEEAVKTENDMILCKECHQKLTEKRKAYQERKKLEEEMFK